MADISEKYNDMFNPYSSVWSVSGTSAPWWAWEEKSTFTELASIPSETDPKKKTEKNTTFYDIRTKDLIAPFSQFSRWQIIDYSGIKGIMHSGKRQLVSRYFDNQLARSGEMWSLEEPTYANIIDAYKDIDAARYRIQDFIYNKYFRMIPPNYLITLRRYGMPCTDEPFTLAYPEDVHQELFTRDAVVPMATATTYMSEIAGNKMDDILKFSWGFNFTEKTSEIQPIHSGTPGATSFGFVQNLQQTGQGSGLAAGFAQSGVNFWTGMNLNTAQQSIADQYAQVDPWAKYSKYTQGPVDVIMKTKIRDQGLNFTNDFNLKFEYELKSLRYVNPKIAMLDIIGNMITMATNSGSFWGGATRYYGNGGGYGKQIGLDKFATGNYAGYAKDLVDHATNQISSMNGGSFPQSAGEWLKLAVGVLKGGLMNMIGSLINGNLGKMGFTQPVNALLKDDPTGYWHVTIGNPLNPIAMMGNMCLTDMEMTMGDGLGYDDFPVNVAFSCKLSHGKPRDAAGIEAIFNAGKGRYMHTPYTAEIASLPPELQREVNAVNKNIQDKKDPMGIGQNFGLKQQSGGSAGNSKGKFSQDSGAGKKLKDQIDNIILLLR